jgi:hypothetical protein
MPIRPFRKTKRILTREEQISMHESAKASAERDHQEKERLIADKKAKKAAQNKSAEEPQPVAAVISKGQSRPRLLLTKQVPRY